MSAVTDPYNPNLRHPDPQNIGNFAGNAGSAVGLTGTGAPSPLLGADGQTYVDLNTNGFYWKSGGQWYPQ